ncbi:MAG: IS1096 element passenger TnpR family protein [Candidatus Saccharimonadales bacterium]
MWRRVLIHPGASFWDLHSTIQDLFGWEDCHLHNFERAYKRNEDRLSLRSRILMTLETR